MGIDIYLRWDGQTEEEEEAQYTGFSCVHGHVGYLREAFHGEPYATHAFVAEAFDGDQDGVAIPAATLRDRLPAAQEATRERYEGCDFVDEAAKSFADFAALAERLESEGKNPRVIAS
ncbi:MAG: hypothetical protein GY820_39355 [Gammaproteobacteria bacterium]|nr:hypothetical protein [Gammaproteobacteria bacterium]